LKWQTSIVVKPISQCRKSLVLAHRGINGLSRKKCGQSALIVSPFRFDENRNLLSWKIETFSDCLTLQVQVVNLHTTHARHILPHPIKEHTCIYGISKTFSSDDSCRTHLSYHYSTSLLLAPPKPPPHLHQSAACHLLCGPGSTYRPAMPAQPTGQCTHLVQIVPPRPLLPISPSASPSILACASSPALSACRARPTHLVQIVPGPLEREVC
jgi:hypothetical protein